MLIERGKVLSPQASYLLNHKYSEIPYMENVHKMAQLDYSYAPTVVIFYWQASVDTSSRKREELQHGQFAPFTGL